MSHWWDIASILGDFYSMPDIEEYRQLYPVENFDIVDLVEVLGDVLVFSGRKKKSGMPVSVRIYTNPNLEQIADFNHFLKSAGYYLRALDCDNVVRVYELGGRRKYCYAAMEKVSGYSVASWYERKGVLQEEDILLVALNCALSVGHVYKTASLVHGGLEASDVEVCQDGMIKVRYLGRLNLFRKRIDFRTDIIALGRIMKELLTPMENFETKVADPVVKDATYRLIEKMRSDVDSFPYRSWDEVIRDIELVQVGRSF